MTEKTKSKTYNFLSENKSIEDIKNQPNITFKEKRRHGGKTYKLIETYNANNQLVNDDISENEIFYDVVDDLNNIPINETLQSQSKIHELEKEIQQLKNEIEKLKQSKQSNINLSKYSYNAITIYNDKKSKTTGIEKIYEEILPIEGKIFFITTFQNINNSLTEEIICFQQLTNDDIQVVQQIKNYKNINDYKKDILLINDILTNSANNFNFQFIPIKDFLKKQQELELEPTKTEKILWSIFTAIALVAGISTCIAITILFFPGIAAIPAVAIGLKVVAAFSSISFIRIFTSMFSSATRKVDLWFGNKLYKNKEQKEKLKKERQSIIKNLTSDKLETRLEAQYGILKQKLNIRKEEIPNQLINKNLNIDEINSLDLRNSQPSTSTRISNLPWMMK